MSRKWTVPAERASLTPQQRTRVFLTTDGHCADCGLRINATGGEPFYCAHNHDDGAALWQGNTRKFTVTDYRPLCEECWIKDTGEEAAQRGEERRARTKAITGRAKPRKGRPMPGSRDDWRKQRLDGVWVNRKTGEPI
jgi:hypothetical protein